MMRRPCFQLRAFPWPAHIFVWLAYSMAMITVNRYHDPDMALAKILAITPLYLVVFYSIRYAMRRGIRHRSVATAGWRIALVALSAYPLGLAYVYGLMGALGIGIQFPEATFSHLAYATQVLAVCYRYGVYAAVFVLAEWLAGTLDYQSATFRRLRSAKAATKRVVQQRDMWEFKALSLQMTPHWLGNLIHNWQGRLVVPAGSGSGIMAAQGVLAYALEGLSAQAEPLVPLKRELKYLRQAIESYVTTTSTCHIRLDVQGGRYGLWRVPSFSLITCLENMVKHGYLLDPRYPASINLEITEEQLRFTTRNLIKEKQGSRWHEGGVGIANLQRRLEIAFPGSFRLRTRQQGDWFLLTLTIARRRMPRVA